MLANYQLYLRLGFPETMLKESILASCIETVSVHSEKGR